MPTDDATDDNERYLIYYDKIGHLRKPGIWNTDAADLLAPALANWANKTVKIFSSNPHRPMQEFSPLIASEPDSNAVIALSFLDLRGAPHYDACISLQRSQESLQVPSQANVDGEQVTEKAQNAYHPPDDIESFGADMSPPNAAENPAAEPHHDGHDEGCVSPCRTPEPCSLLPSSQAPHSPPDRIKHQENKELLAHLPKRN